MVCRYIIITIIITFLDPEMISQYCTLVERVSVWKISMCHLHWINSNKYSGQFKRMLVKGKSLNDLILVVILVIWREKLRADFSSFLNYCERPSFIYSCFKYKATLLFTLKLNNLSFRVFWPKIIRFKAKICYPFYVNKLAS